MGREQQSYAAWKREEESIMFCGSVHCCSLGSCAAELNLWGTSITQITNSHPPREKYWDPAPDLRLKRDTKWKRSTWTVASYAQISRIWFLHVACCNHMSSNGGPGKHSGTSLPAWALKDVSAEKDQRGKSGKVAFFNARFKIGSV